ncbi:glycosyltransferase [Xanthobacter sp. DSM 24535]|uniref:glycosyltransferase n=1 Tax=Roseixanthobacter psychrophilus TaxID=3119917 RepID=UPI00372A8B82
MKGASLTLGISLTAPAFFEPTRVAAPADFVEHFPFCSWLIDILRPRLIVAVGSRTSNPHLSFLDIVAQLGAPVRCVAVSGWDAKAPGEARPPFGTSFNRADVRVSELVVESAAKAYAGFTAGSVDLLCFDAVPRGEIDDTVLDHWLSRLSPSAILLLHGLEAPGAAPLWRTLRVRYPSFVFPQGQGLAVLAMGERLPAPLQPLFDPLAAPGFEADVQHAFARLGKTLKAVLPPHIQRASREGGDGQQLERLSQQLDSERERADFLALEASRLRRQVQDQTAELHHVELQLFQKEGQLVHLAQRHHSLTWLSQRMGRAIRLVMRRQSGRLAKLFGITTASYVIAKNRKKIARSNLFDAVYYLRRYPDVAAEGTDPLTHYMLHGAADGRDPNPVFRTRWYEGRYPDVVALGENPLLHYVQHGSSEGRMPSPDFDPRWYLTTYPDVAALGMDPLLHFLTHGRGEGRTGVPQVEGEGLGFLKPHRRNKLEIGDFIASPVPRFDPALQIIDDVAVILPVYSGYAETRACIESVLASRRQNQTFDRLIIVDDCGPEPELRAYVRDVAESTPGVVLLVNDENQGFVVSVNRGMIEAGARDVILLNSDTLVHGDWVDRMAAHAAADPHLATVTPFSNNATICSYPEIGEGRGLPEGVTLAQIDDVCVRVNAGRAVEVPTGVGYCMLIKRACLEDVGLFDERAFGKGYGEETDFCCRASMGPWRHVIAGDVFVYHAGNVSFGSSSQIRKEESAHLIRARHPSYEPAVSRWVRDDPAFPLRLAVEACLIRDTGLPVILHVLHPWGGGTEKQVVDLMVATAGRAISLALIVTPPNAGSVVPGIALFVPNQEGGRRIEMRVNRLGDIARVLRAFGVQRVHVHHALTAMDELAPFLAVMNLPYDVSVHDYALICPRINLAQRGNYCGEPDEQGCLACLAADPKPFSSEIIWWRERGLGLINGAERVICPSRDVADRIRRYAPHAHLMVVPHEPALYRRPAPVMMPPLDADEPLRVATLGILAEHKGGVFLLDCVEYSQKIGAPLEWTVIGEFPNKLDIRAAGLRTTLVATGRYTPDALPALLAKSDPHLIFFPQHWPETYSFTLSEAFAAERAVLVPPLGAFTERVEGTDGAIEYPLSATPKDIVEILLDLRARLLDPARGPASLVPAVPGLGETWENRDFYQSAYLTP